MEVQVAELYQLETPIKLIYLGDTNWLTTKMCQLTLKNWVNLSQVVPNVQKAIKLIYLGDTNWLTTEMCLF